MGRTWRARCSVWRTCPFSTVTTTRWGRSPAYFEETIMADYKPNTKTTYTEKLKAEAKAIETKSKQAPKAKAKG